LLEARYFARRVGSIVSDPRLLDFVKEHPETVTQSMSFGFNPPQSVETTINATAHIGGPAYFAAQA
jgi:hypothetical protein